MQNFKFSWFQQQGSLGPDVLWGLKSPHRDGLARSARWDFTVVMSTATNQKFFGKRWGGPGDKELSNYQMWAVTGQFVRHEEEIMNPDLEHQNRGGTIRRDTGKEDERRKELNGSERELMKWIRRQHQFRTPLGLPTYSSEVQRDIKY